jgi:hypothetical protein
MDVSKLSIIDSAARAGGLSVILLGLILAFSPLHASDALLPNDVKDAIQLLGEDFLVESISAPDLVRPAEWVGRSEGEYYFRYVSGDDHGKHEQVELHRPDPDNPHLAWSRHIGETIIEEITVVDGQGISIHTETDIEHGYRVEIHPGLSIPVGSAKGDVWKADNTLTVFDLGEPNKVAYTGSMTSLQRYVGAYRVKVPAGLFDTVLLEEDYKIRIGPLKGDDVRYVFYAKGVGVVAEVEGIRASALIVFRMKEKSAKVLERYPSK